MPSGTSTNKPTVLAGNEGPETGWFTVEKLDGMSEAKMRDLGWTK